MVMMSDQGYAYRVVTAHEPGAVSRVLEFFALNSYAPESLHAHRVGEDEMALEVTVSDLEYARARVIASKIRQLVVVRDVRLFAAVRKAVVGASGGVMDYAEVMV